MPASSAATIVFGGLTVMTTTACTAALVLPMQPLWTKVITFVLFGLSSTALLWNLFGAATSSSGGGP